MAATPLASAQLQNRGRLEPMVFSRRTPSCQKRPGNSLENVLCHRHAVVLGDAGSGKSIVARKAIELAAQQGLIPIFLPLAAYAGNLSTLIRQHSSDEVLRATGIEGTPTHRLYIFDGYDEVAVGRFNDLVGEINALAQGEPDSRHCQRKLA